VTAFTGWRRGTRKPLWCLSAQGDFCLTSKNEVMNERNFTDELLNNKEYREELAWLFLKKVLVDIEDTDLHQVRFAIDEVLHD
jgi:hypothetical protein